MELIKGKCFICGKACENSSTEILHYECAIKKWNEILQERKILKDQNSSRPHEH